VKPLIVGQAPGPAGAKGRALDGEDARGSGARLAAVMGIDLSRFLELFDTANLLECWPGSAGGKGDAFPLAAARARAQAFDAPNRVVILLGLTTVARVFGIPGSQPVLRFFPLAGRAFAVVPHSSGIVRWWNVKANRKAAAAFLWSSIDVAKSIAWQAGELVIKPDTWTAGPS